MVHRGILESGQTGTPHDSLGGSKLRPSLAALVSVLLACSATAAPASPRARDLGVPFDGTPGPLSAITDVPGVEVGRATIILGDGKLEVGKGRVRTGVTAVLLRGKASSDMAMATWSSLNGDGEMAGTTWLDDAGFLHGAVMLTNTPSVGVVRDATIAWRVRHAGPDKEGYWWSMPVVGKTWDGFLNDVNGFHVGDKHVFGAIDSAAGCPVAEGNSGGTSMVCFEFK